MRMHTYRVDDYSLRVRHLRRLAPFLSTCHGKLQAGETTGYDAPDLLIRTWRHLSIPF